MVFGNRILGRIFEPKMDVVQGTEENNTMRNLVIGTAHLILFG